MSPEEQILAIIHKCFEVAGPDLVGIVQYEISTPYPPASEARTPPHLRTGDLQAGIHFTIDEHHDGVTLNVVSEMFYSSYLKNGTTKMQPRDFMNQNVANRLEERLIQVCNEQMANGIVTSPIGFRTNYEGSQIYQPPGTPVGQMSAAQLSGLFGIEFAE